MSVNENQGLGTGASALQLAQIRDDASKLTQAPQLPAVTVQRAIQLLQTAGAMLKLGENGDLTVLLANGEIVRVEGARDLVDALRERVSDPQAAFQREPGFIVEILERFADRSADAGGWLHAIDALSRTMVRSSIPLQGQEGGGFHTATTESMSVPRAPESQQFSTVSPGLPAEGVGGVFIASGIDSSGNPVSASARDFVGLVEHRSFVRTMGVGTNLAHLPGLPDEDPMFFNGWRRLESPNFPVEDTRRNTLGPAPAASEDDFTAPEDTRMSGNIIENDANTAGASVTLGDPPPVGTLALNSDGTFTFDPPANFSGDVRFTYFVTDTNGRTTEGEVILTFMAVADAPVITVPPQTVNEDTALNIGAAVSLALVDTDGSEALTQVTLAGVPVGSTVTYVSVGAVVITPTATGYVLTGPEVDIRATLATISLTPPANSDVDFTLTLTATTTDENGSTATTSIPMPVTVVAVTDTPMVATGGTYTTPEDTFISLTGLTGALTDTDGSETLAFRITGVPAGSSFTSGIDLGGGNWSFTATEIAAGITFVPLAQSSGTFPMVLESIATETSTGAAVTSTAPFTIVIQPVVDVPVLMAGASTINEDGVVPFGANLSLALADTDGSQSLSVTLSGIPGAALVAATLTGGATLTNLGGGSYLLTGTASAVLATLPTLIITPAPHNAVDFTVGLSVTTTEISTGLSSTLTGSHSVTIIAVADQPSLNVGAGSFPTLEDTPVQLTGLAGALVDADGSETLSFTISNVPTGASFDRGTDLGGGVWRFTPADIAAGLTFTPPLDARGTFAMVLTATTTEAENASTANRALPFSVVIDGVADPVTILSSGSSGLEDSFIAVGSQLTIALQDTDGSETISAIEIRNIPTGATLSWNTGLPGTVTDLGGGVIRITGANEAEIRALFASTEVRPPLNSDVAFSLDIAVTSQETTGSTYTTVVPHAVTITAVADAPTVPTTGTTGNEDTPILFGPNVTYALTDADGSERVSAVALSSFPAGSVVAYTASGTATVALVAGVYTISGPNAADIRTTLSSFRVTPPLNSDTDFAVTVSVTTTDTGGSTATTTGTHTITVTAVADQPNVPTTSSTGNEDTSITVGSNITYSLNDTDGSEVISAVAVSGMPAGGVLTYTASGAAVVSLVSGTCTVTGTAADIRATLNTFAITPLVNSDVDFALTVVVTSADNDGSTATRTGTHNVIVNAVADAPTVPTTGTTGNEDTPILFGPNVTYALTDADGSERVSAVALSSFPAGSVVAYTASGTATVALVAGVYTISGPNAADIRTTLSSFRVTPPSNSDTDFAVTVAVTTTDTGGSTATTVGAHTITVTAVADQPNVPTRTTIGNEDTFISFGVNTLYSLVDADGSEVISDVRLSGFPGSSTVNYTASGAATVSLVGGVYTIAGTQTDIRATLDTFRVRAPSNSDVDFSLTVRATTTDNDGSTAFRNGTHNIVVTAVADQPSVTVPGSAVVTTEDTAVAIPGLGGALTDADGSETLTFRISGVPTTPGAGFTTGTNLGGGVWSFTPAQILAGLTFTPPTNFSGSVVMTLQSISTETTGGSTANNTANFTVTVNAVADQVSLTGGSSIVNEDAFVTFGAGITYSLVDADGSESVTAVALSTFPIGSSVTYTASGAAVVSFVSGTYTITGSAADIRATLNSFAVRAPTNSDVDFTIGVAVTTTDTGGSTATRTGTHSVRVDAITDAPTVGTGAPITTAEDTPVAISGLAGALTDTDGSETLAFQITAVPAGSSFNRGTDLGGGIWSFTPADITAGITWSPTAQASGTFTMNLIAIARETSTGATASTSAPFDIIVTPVVDAPVLNSGSTTLNEDAVIPLGSAIDLNLADLDGSQTMTITLSGIPASVVLASTASGGAVVTNMGGGVYTISGPAAGVLTTLDTITATEPANRDLNFTVAVNVSTTETATGATATASGTHDFTIRAVADQPTVSGGVSTPEDVAVAVPITVALTDTDGSETLQSVTVAGVPAGATFGWNTGLPGTVMNLGGGSYSFTGSTSEIQALLLSITLAPPSNRGTDITLVVTAVSTESNPTEAGDVAVLTATRVSNVVIDLVPVADAPTVVVPGSPYTVEEDTFVALTGLGGALVDTDGSEVLSFQITGVPAGATFNGGTNLGGGVWSFTPAQLGTLQFRGPTNLSGTYNLTLVSIARETENNVTAQTSAPFTIIVDDQADAPSISGSSVGNEDTAINFGVDALVALVDTDGSEQLTSIYLENIPAGTSIAYTAVGSASVVFAAGRYTITGSTAEMQATLDTFTITPAVNDDTNLTVRIGATVIDADSSTAFFQRDHVIVVRAVADAPVSVANDVSGWEDQNIALSLVAALTDMTQEMLSARITLSSSAPVLTADTSGGGAFTSLGGGVYTVTAASASQLNAILSSVTLRAPLNFSGTYTGTLQITSTEAATGGEVAVATAVTSDTFSVTVGAVADLPTGSARAATGPNAGYEDTPIALVITGATPDTDGSEVLSCRIANVPVGASFVNAVGGSIGTSLGGGVFSFTQAELATLRIIPPLNSSADFVLQVTVITTEVTPGLPGDGATQSVTFALPVQVIGVADLPTLIVTPVISPEDQLIPLGANIAGALVDADGSEVLYYILAGLPPGVNPSVGTYIGGEWQISASQIGLLTIPAPLNFSGNYTALIAPGLSIRAVTQEYDGNQIARTLPLNVTITPVTDAFPGWSPGVGVVEDNTISLASIGSGFTLIDNDGSERVVSYTINLNSIISAAQIGGRVSSVASFIANHINGTFTNNGDGTITVLPANIGGISFSTSPFLNSNVDFTLPVIANVREIAGATVQVAGTFSVDLLGEADTPTVFASGVSGLAGSYIAINPTGQEFGGARTDTDAALGRVDSERLYYIVSGLTSTPGLNFAFYNASNQLVGLDNGDGTWLLNPADLVGLQIRSAPGQNGSASLSLTSVVVENDGDIATSITSAQFTVTVLPDPGGSGTAPRPPIVTISPTSGNEDTNITFQVSAMADPQDPSPSTPTVIVLFSNIPSGARIVGATYNPTTGRYIATEAQVNTGQVYIVPPANFSGQLNVTVEAIASNVDLLRATTGLLNMPITVVPVADGVNISAAPTAGLEDVPVALNLSLSLRDTNGTQFETLVDPVRITLTGGATLSAGTALGGGVYEVALANIAGLQVIPATNRHGTVLVTVEAISRETANGATQSSTSIITLNFAAVGDQPNVTAANATGVEDTVITLAGLSAALVDTDGSEVLSVKLLGVPAGSILNHGSNNGDGTWTINPNDLSTLTIRPPTHYSGTLSLTLEAYGLDVSGSVGTTSVPFSVNISPAADGVSIDAQNVTSTPTTSVMLNLGLRLEDNTGTLAGENPGETLDIIFSNVLAEATLQSLSGVLTRINATTWHFTGSVADSQTLSITNPSLDGADVINVAVRAVDGSSYSSTELDVFQHIQAPAALAPSLDAIDMTNVDDGVATALSIVASLTDRDGSETLSFLLSGLPTGTSLNQGTNLGGGNWSLAAGDVSGLTLTTAIGQGDFAVTVQAISTEIANGATALASDLLQVRMAA